MKLKQSDIDPVQIWAIDLRSLYACEKKLVFVLDETERIRSSQFKFGYLRTHYILCHGLLRYLLSHYLKSDPIDFVFRYGQFGKPYLYPKRIQFNMSHSHTHALYAFSSMCELGIDIEFIPSNAHLDQLPLAALTSPQQRDILALPKSEQVIGFYKKWVEIEAYTKALGVGLNALPIEIDEKKVKLLEVHLPSEYIGFVALVSPNPLIMCQTLPIKPKGITDLKSILPL